MGPISTPPFSFSIILFLCYALLTAVAATAISPAPAPTLASFTPIPPPATASDPPILSQNPNTPPPPPPISGRCPRDALKLAVCLKLLGGLININIGQTPIQCCPLLAGLVDLEVAVCLCTAIKANLLGIPLNVQLPLSLPINTCGKRLPDGFKCV